ncbi:MAG: hypothetical protein QOH79_2193 [Acidimicrobiaceae bacterium]
MLSGAAVLVIGALVGGHNPFDAHNWATFDSGLYREISERGYWLKQCDGVANRSASDWCGNAAWAPALPVLMHSGRWIGIAWSKRASSCRGCAGR